MLDLVIDKQACWKHNLLVLSRVTLFWQIQTARIGEQSERSLDRAIRRLGKIPGRGITAKTKDSAINSRLLCASDLSDLSRDLSSIYTLRQLQLLVKVNDGIGCREHLLDVLQHIDFKTRLGELHGCYWDSQ